jgi:hypothetical protein
MIAKFYDQTRAESLLVRVSDFGFYDKVEQAAKRASAPKSAGKRKKR